MSIGCQYEIYKDGKMQECGEPATKFTRPMIMMKLTAKTKNVPLCDFHRAFVLDCINRYEIELFKLEKSKLKKRTTN